MFFKKKPSEHTPRIPLLDIKNLPPAVKAQYDRLHAEQNAPLRSGPTGMPVVLAGMKRFVFNRWVGTSLLLLTAAGAGAYYWMNKTEPMHKDLGPEVHTPIYTPDAPVLNL